MDSRLVSNSTLLELFLPQVSQEDAGFYRGLTFHCVIPGMEVFLSGV